MSIRDASPLVFAYVLTSAGMWARAETLRIRAYTVAEGLAHDHVSRIYRDSRKFLWICTDEGLSRFDGRRFANYTTADGLPHIHVNDIVETRGGDYWVATDGGVTLFRPNHPEKKFVTFKPDGPPAALFVNALLEEPDGAVLLGTEGGLYRLWRSALAPRFERIEFGAPAGVPAAANVHRLYMDQEGTLWVGTSSGLYHREGTTTWNRYTARDGLPHDFVERIVAGLDGRIWICTRHGLGRLATRPRPGMAIDLTITPANGLPHRDVRTILFAASGRRWIGTVGGLVEWVRGPPSSSNFRVYSSEDGLTDREIYELATDPDGNLWIGTRRGGIMCLSRSEFETFGGAEGLVLSGTDTLLETRSGAICAASIDNPWRTIRCFDGQRFRRRAPRLPASAVAMTSSNYATIVDSRGAWWISTPFVLCRFRGSASHLGAPEGLPDLRLIPGRESRRLFEDGRHDIWVTTFAEGTFGLMRWQRAGSRLAEYRVPPVVRERGVTALAEAPAGQLWIGLARPGGIFRWRDGQFHEVKGAPAGTVEALYRDHANRLWIASAEAGLARIDDPAADRIAMRVYARSNGLSSNEIWCVTEDRHGRIYAGTARGVDRLDPATNRIVHYSAADGLTKGDIRAALRDRDGNLWFLSNQGLSRLRPTTNVPQRLNARITAIRVAGASHPLSEVGEINVTPAVFDWNRNSVQIEFSAIAFQSPEQVRYQFRLHGAAGDWSEPSPDSTVRFSNLAPGHYHFLVRAINSEGIPGESPAAFRFEISLPPWRRWWFQAGLALFLVVLGYVAHRFRLERQLALERVRSRIATDLHDDIGASLSRIAVMGEVVKERVSAVDSDSQRMLVEIAETSRMLVDTMSDIVWSIDPRRDNLGDVVARLRAFGSDVLESRGINWHCEGPSDALNQSLSSSQRRQLYLIFKEAIHNIARHSGAQNVVLGIRVENHYVRGAIQDDGRGVPLNGVRGLGLTSMRDRAVRLGGIFQITPRPEGGTEATLHFPLDSRKA